MVSTIAPEITFAVGAGASALGAEASTDGGPTAEESTAELSDLEHTPKTSTVGAKTNNERVLLDTRMSVEVLLFGDHRDPGDAKPSMTWNEKSSTIR
jgi:hypothetical protein